MSIEIFPAKVTDKEFRPDIFCCKVLQRLIRDRYAHPYFLTSDYLELELQIENGYFHPEERIASHTLLRYCNGCGKKITDADVRKIIDNTNGLQYPSYYLRKHPELIKGLSKDKVHTSYFEMLDEDNKRRKNRR